MARRSGAVVGLGVDKARGCGALCDGEDVRHVVGLVRAPAGGRDGGTEGSSGRESRSRRGASARRGVWVLRPEGAPAAGGGAEEVRGLAEGAVNDAQAVELPVDNVDDAGWGDDVC